MPWHKFKSDQKVSVEKIVATCQQHIQSGRVKSPEEKMQRLEQIKTCGHPVLVFKPFGRAWGLSPMNPNTWRTPRGETIGIPQIVPRQGHPSHRYENNSDYNPVLLAEELPTDELFWEGAMCQITVNAYERDSTARQRCLDHYGVTCSACGMSFEEHYGRHAARIIHVHHEVPLREIGEEYQVDPIKDLKPVCPNCHAVIHAVRPARTIEQVAKMRKG